MEEEILQIINTDIVVTLEKELRNIAEIIKRKGREILKDYNITPPQFVALQWLQEDGEMTIGELSTKMYLAFSTMTDLVDRMERNQLVERARDKKDRRVVRVKLLAEGERIIAEVILKRQQYLQGVLKNFSEKEIYLLQQNLTKLQQEMQKNEG